MRFEKSLTAYVFSLIAAGFVTVSSFAPAADGGVEPTKAATQAEKNNGIGRASLRLLRSAGLGDSTATTSSDRIEPRSSVAAVAAIYDDHIPADNHIDNKRDVVAVFGSDPGPHVDFSVSAGCGSVSPGRVTPDEIVPFTLWRAISRYRPCETECSAAAVEADPANFFVPSVYWNVHLDERLHTGKCMDPPPLALRTFDAITGAPARACVEVSVVPSYAGDVVCDGTSTCPGGWLSDYDSFLGEWVLTCSYTAESYAGRVRARYQTDDSVLIISYEQNTGLTPAPAWQTVSDDLPTCDDSQSPNSRQVYKMNLSSSKSYDFSLCDADGVGAWAVGDGDLTMCNSWCDCSQPAGWYIDGQLSCGWDASTLASSQYPDGWSPEASGSHYLRVLGYLDGPLSYTMAYREAQAPPRCGDGVVDFPNEQCDDGNTTPCDGCGADCMSESSDCCRFVSADVPKPIPDLGSVGSTVSIPVSGSIADVDVIDLAGTHSWVGDLEFHLIDPANTNVTIIDRVCGSDDDFDLGLDDEAIIPAIPCPPIDGQSHWPGSPLATFDGEDPSGTWTLQVFDRASGDTGSLNSWGLQVCVSPVECGDGVVDLPGEQCDDGNTNPGDCCSATCQYESVGSICGDSSDTQCSDPDTCNAGGICLGNHANPGTACGDQGIECLQDDSCNGTGTCVDNGFAPVGAPCGDSSDTECTDPDTCNGGGSCGDNHASPGTACGDQGVECLQDDSCNGTGTCVDNGFSPPGTPCNDGDTCTEPDQCVAGICEGNPDICGDGTLQGSCGEECDDGNTASCDGCSPVCVIVPDTDGDGTDDPCDNCRYRANSDQADANGDGAGNVCQCADMNGDGFVNGADLTLYKRYFGGLASPFSTDRCGVSPAPDGGTCDGADLTIIKRHFGGLPPGLTNTCSAYVGP